MLVDAGHARRCRSRGSCGRGASPVTWVLPDLKWGFKYDLDLIQATALGAAALLAPVVTYLVGRYHPRVARPGEAACRDDNERVRPPAAEE